MEILYGVTVRREELWDNLVVFVQTKHVPVLSADGTGCGVT